MTHKAILEKATQKAIDGGWKGFNYRGEWFTGPTPTWFIKDAKYYEDTHEFASSDLVSVGLNELIFNHDFARSIWGELDVKEFFQPWQMHLREMVISEDPIKYLGENI